MYEGYNKHMIEEIERRRNQLSIYVDLMRDMLGIVDRDNRKLIEIGYG